LVWNFRILLKVDPFVTFELSLDLFFEHLQFVCAKFPHVTAALFGSYGHGKSSLGNSLDGVSDAAITMKRGKFLKPFATAEDTTHSKTTNWVFQEIGNGTIKLFDNPGFGQLGADELKVFEKEIKGQFKSNKGVNFQEDSKVPDQTFFSNLKNKIWPPGKPGEVIDVSIFVWNASCEEDVLEYREFLKFLADQTGVEPFVVLTQKDKMSKEAKEDFVKKFKYDTDYLFFVQNYTSKMEFTRSPRDEDDYELFRLLNRILEIGELAQKRRKSSGCSIL